MILSRKLATLAAGMFAVLGTHQCVQAAASPKKPDWEQLIGQPMPTPIKKIIWAAPEPTQTNLSIYSVQPARYDPNRLKVLAGFMGMKGDPVRMPDSTDIAPGYWIKYPSPTNSSLWQSVFFSERTGVLGYGSPDNGYRWDLKNHKPMVSGVPTHSEALAKALTLLPILGITTNELELNSDGSLRRQFTKDVTGYNERTSNERKEMLQKRSVTFFQRVPTGETLSVGEGGTIEVAFISEGKIAQVSLLFRKLTPAGTANSMGAKQLVARLEHGKAWTFRPRLPETLTVTNCAVAYPQGNSSYPQKYLWPVYRVTGFGASTDGTQTYSLFIPTD